MLCTDFSLCIDGHLPKEVFQADPRFQRLLFYGTGHEKLKERKSNLQESSGSKIVLISQSACMDGGVQIHKTFSSGLATGMVVPCSAFFNKEVKTPSYPIINNDM